MQQAQIKVRKAARALAKAGILVACSMRIEKRHFPLCAANPMG
jgi:hypothetical protein